MPAVTAATAAALRPRRKRLETLLMMCGPSLLITAVSDRHAALSTAAYTDATINRFTTISSDLRHSERTVAKGI
jgi:hypothetical protein